MRTKNDYVKGCKLNLNGCYPVFKNEIDPTDVFNIAFSTFTAPVHANFFTKLQCYYCDREFTYKFIPKRKKK